MNRINTLFNKHTYPAILYGVPVIATFLIIIFPCNTFECQARFEENPSRQYPPVSEWKDAKQSS
jgi:hypothetical protein